MSLNLTKKFLSFAQRIFFEELGGKFDAKDFKKIMDFLYVIFEKICIKFKTISLYYMQLYHELIDKEIKMANISRSDKVLVIGCGSLPTTSVLIFNKSGSDVTGIDIDPLAIKNASEYLERIDLKDNIKLELADGITYPIDKYDVIFLLYGIRKHQDILQLIAKNMKESSRVVFRTSISDEVELKNDTKMLSKWFDVKSHIVSKTLFPVGSYLLLKQK